MDYATYFVCIYYGFRQICKICLGCYTEDVSKKFKNYNFEFKTKFLIW